MTANPRPQTAGAPRDILDLPLPSNVQAEKDVLGAVLLDPQCFDDLAAVLRADDFYDDANARLFEYMLKLSFAGKRIDATLLVDLLKRDGHYEAVGGLAYLSELIHGVPHAVSAPYYAEIVRQHAMRRAIICASQDNLRDVIDQTQDARQVLSTAESRLFTIGDRDTTVASRSATDLLNEALSRISARMQGGGGIQGTPTGFIDFDQMSGGLHPGGVTILAARPSMGKSALALNIAENVALDANVGTLVVSLEMNADELTDRMLCSRARVDSRKVRDGTLTAIDRQALVEAAAEIGNAPLWIDDAPSRSMTQIASLARRHKRRNELGLLVIDYLQLIEPEDARDSRQEQVAKIARRLKTLARELGVPLLCLAQLNRQTEATRDNRPRLSHLRECVSGDTTLIDARSGELVRIDKLKPGSLVLGVNKDHKTRAGIVANVWSTGTKNTFAIRTRSGRELRCTSNHPLLTFDGWKDVAALSVGDRIAVSFRADVKCGEHDPRFRLLGYLAGNGSVQKHRTIGLIMPDKAAFDDAVSIVKKHWPEVQVKLRANGYNDAWLSVPKAGPFGNPLINWLRDIGFYDMRDCDKRVPAFVFNGGFAGASQFLAGYLASDGCVKRSKRGRWIVHFDTTSHGLAQDVAVLCARLGVLARISPPAMNTKSARPIYRITVSEDSDNVLRFSNLVCPKGRKGVALDQAGLDAQKKPTRASAFALPRTVSAYAATIDSSWRDQGKGMSRRRCREVAIATRDAELLKHAESDVIWDPIADIRHAGECETFDVQIPGLNCFIANGGIVAHNSGAIEQDADVVLFIHRDEYYATTEEDRKRKAGQADLIVAKQRSGPIGDVKLTWLAKFTRFANAAPDAADFTDEGAPTDAPAPGHFQKNAGTKYVGHRAREIF